MSFNIKSEECNYIDYIRFIGIFLVVFGHTYFNESTIFIKNCIYLFHMPLFFVVSGMLHKDGISKALNSFIGMFFIYLLYNLPWFFYGQNVMKILTFDMMPNIPTWFFLTLGCVKLICFNMNKINLVILSTLSIFILYYVHYYPLELYNNLISSICMAVPFYVFGFCLKDKLHKMNINNLIVILCFIVIIVSATFIGRVDMYQGNYGSSYILYFFIALIGCLGVCGISKKMSKNSNAFVYYISRGSGFIVATHFILCSRIWWRFHMNIIGNLAFTLLLLVLYYPILKIIVVKYPILLGKLKLNILSWKNN